MNRTSITRPTQVRKADPVESPATVSVPATGVYRAIIVEDEAVARRHLAALLTAHPSIDLVGEAASVAEGLQLCSQLRPHLLLLDISLGSRDGFDLLAELDYAPKIIFLTAHPNFAVRAFELQAVDYLMKPIFEKRLDQALRRLPPDPAALNLAKPSRPHRPHKINSLFLSGESGTEYLQIDRISFIRSSGNYSKVHVAGWKKPALVHRSLVQWSGILPGYPFVQASRSLIVNVGHIHSVNFSMLPGSLHMKGFEEPVHIGRLAIQRLRPVLHLK